ncbi:MAG: endonuclease dU [Candidatus Bathycorpusculaceae bacterium]
MSCKKLRVIKPEIRVLGIDDGVFTPRVKGLVPVIGVVFRGGYWLDGVMHTDIEVDGFDATNKIISMIKNSPHYKQLRIIMLDGVTFAGFNVVDIARLNAETKLPVIAVTREKPNFEEIHKALKNLPKGEERWKAILNAGEVFEVTCRNESEKVYIQISGIFKEDAEKILRLTSTRSNIPEALRVAHLIASGISAA